MSAQRANLSLILFGMMSLSCSLLWSVITVTTAGFDSRTDRLRARSLVRESTCLASRGARVQIPPGPPKKGAFMAIIYPYGLHQKIHEVVTNMYDQHPQLTIAIAVIGVIAFLVVCYISNKSESWQATQNRNQDFSINTKEKYAKRIHKPSRRSRCC